MTRLFALLIVLMIAVYLYQRARLAIAHARDEVSKRADGSGGVAVPLVACTLCGVRLPAARAVVSADGSERPYCSPGCRDRDQDA